MVLRKRALAVILQFIKYGICGGVATAIHIAVFFLLGWFCFPCLTQDDLVVRLFKLTVGEIDESKRGVFALICSTCGFIVSNVVCWVLNRMFVFTPGRHSKIVEFLLFFSASGLSLLIGSAVQTLLIAKFGCQTSYSFGANILSSLMVNFAARKLIVFKG